MQTTGLLRLRRMLMREQNGQGSAKPMLGAVPKEREIQLPGS